MKKTAADRTINAHRALAILDSLATDTKAAEARCFEAIRFAITTPIVAVRTIIANLDVDAGIAFDIISR